MTIIDHIHALQRSLIDTAQEAHRDPKSITLLAVSKGHSTDQIQEAFEAGLQHMGENYLKEALLKQKILSALPLCWHFIGPIQSNKAARIAEHFSWVHTISNLNVAEKLSRSRPSTLPPLNICIQVNLDKETTKSGVTEETIRSLIQSLLLLPRLHLRGLMLIPKQTEDEQAQMLSFLRLTRLLSVLNQDHHIDMDTLSMGMSQDYKAAIRAGSTLIRLGTAIFGRRGS